MKMLQYCPSLTLLLLLAPATSTQTTALGVLEVLPASGSLLLNKTDLLCTLKLDSVSATALANLDPLALKGWAQDMLVAWAGTAWGAVAVEPSFATLLDGGWLELLFRLSLVPLPIEHATVVQRGQPPTPFAVYQRQEAVCEPPGGPLPLPLLDAKFVLPGTAISTSQPLTRAQLYLCGPSHFVVRSCRYSAAS